MLSPDLTVSGWNGVFVGTFILSAIYVWMLRRHAHPDTRRIMTGFILLVLGVSIRIAGWLPWRGLRELGKTEEATAWLDYATYWTGGGALVMVVGMAVLLWPALKRIGAPLLGITLIETSFFFGGAGLSILLAKYLF